MIFNILKLVDLLVEEDYVRLMANGGTEFPRLCAHVYHEMT